MMLNAKKPNGGDRSNKRPKRSETIVRDRERDSPKRFAASPPDQRQTLRQLEGRRNACSPASACRSSSLSRLTRFNSRPSPPSSTKTFSSPLRPAAAKPGSPAKRSAACSAKRKRAWYTTPLKALTNSKYAEFRSRIRRGKRRHPDRRPQGERRRSADRRHDRDLSKPGL